MSIAPEAMLTLGSPLYPHAGPQGGRLLRKTISFLRKQGVSLPITSHILIAVSGGPDSVALAHLITHLGRRIVHRSKISFLHINHHWRQAESDADEAFVRYLAEKWSVPLICHQLNSPHSNMLEKASLEEKARTERNRIFREEAQKQGALIFTAHQSDDLAETLLWRIFSGNAKIQGGGIWFQHEVQMRPLLNVTKDELIKYLKEVNQSYRIDSTNFERRFLRSKMREVLLPEIQKLFPKAMEHLVQLALSAQSKEETALPDAITPLVMASGIQVRRPHLEAMRKLWMEKKAPSRGVDLPGGWRLTYIPHRRDSKTLGEKWVLENLGDGANMAGKKNESSG